VKRETEEDRGRRPMATPSSSPHYLCPRPVQLCLWVFLFGPIGRAAGAVGPSRLGRPLPADRRGGRRAPGAAMATACRCRAAALPSRRSQRVPVRLRPPGDQRPGLAARASGGAEGAELDGESVDRATINSPRCALSDTFREIEYQILQMCKRKLKFLDAGPEQVCLFSGRWNV
jgi:hypothetical protein